MMNSLKLKNHKIADRSVLTIIIFLMPILLFDKIINQKYIG